MDVVDLQIYDNGMPVNKYDMSRDLKVAISEYAPDSEVIVDGKKYTHAWFEINIDINKNNRLYIFFIL